MENSLTEFSTKPYTLLKENDTLSLKKNSGTRETVQQLRVLAHLEE